MFDALLLSCCLVSIFITLSMRLVTAGESIHEAHNNGKERELEKNRLTC